ncbi:MAG TPA: sulfatase-like hydrolase/transferase [Vicinamibacterales bacterium]|nr:sulfatase-like hydrolase/transferase [Vicinamibacterales bacterium]
MKSAAASALVSLCVVGASALCLVSGACSRSLSLADGPIVLISIDTLRADHLPAYGYDKVRTPAIDALAADGIVFERAYSHAPQTLPSHASILSGRLPFETGVRDNVGFSVKPGERMLPQLLHEQSYATAGIVSAFVLRKETGIGQGFDVFDAEMPPATVDTNIAEVRRDGAQSEGIAERWVDAQATQRFFLFLHLYEPHKPYASPARFAQYAPYDGAIAYADEIVGRLIAHLKARQLYDASTIVLLSDHGEGLGDHGELEHGLFVYDEAIHVPLIVKQPASAGSGRRIADVVSHVDVVPTILDFVHAPSPGNLRGQSLVPALRGGGHPSERAVYSEAMYARYHFGWSELTALTESRYRYIKAPHDELYDLQRDPHERENLAGTRAPARDALRAALDRMVSGVPIQAPSDVPADARERLKALGYVGASADLTTPSETLPDPKDKRAILERYRAAIEEAGQRQWGKAIGLLQQILRDDPGMADVWDQLAIFATRLGRDGLALDAYKRYITLRPAEPAGYLGAAGMLLRMQKLKDAREHALLAARVATAADTRSRESAHELLAKIALAQHDPAEAKSEAALAHEADPRLPIEPFVDARLLYDQGRYADALPHFEEALRVQRESGGAPLAELHYYAGDTYARLERYPQALEQFAAELHDFPQNARAHAGVAMVQQASGHPDLAAQAIADMLRAAPTAESFDLAARLWTMFGDARQAESVRAQARQLFGGAPK